MIVSDASIFIDLLFEYNPERTKLADDFLRFLEGHDILIFEPEIFKIELIGQISRRVGEKRALSAAEEIFKKINFFNDYYLYDESFEIALKTGSRAIDSFYVALAKIMGAVFVSNDKFQVNSAIKSGVIAYNLLQDRGAVIERLSRR